MQSFDAIIVGAGAAGLIAADIASERGRSVLLIEKMPQAGRKLRITGKGRCNLTNLSSVEDFCKHLGPDSRFLRNAFSVFFVEELMQYFEQRGLPLVTERGSRVFPASQKALDVFLTLMTRLEKRKNVSILKNSQVVALLTEGQSIRGVQLLSGANYISEHVLISTGGLSYPLCGSTGDGYDLATSVGHHVSDLYPALVPFLCEETIPYATIGFALKNIALSQWVNGKKKRELFGEMSFMEGGIEGPLVLSLSRLLTDSLAGGQKAHLQLDFKPSLTEDQLNKNLLNEIQLSGNDTVEQVFRKFLPKELLALSWNYTGLSPQTRVASLKAEQRKSFVRFLKSFPLTIIGTLGFEDAIITKGGVLTKEVNPKTMESNLCKGLYLAGEILDLDADTGGYNLQIAFTTGYVAGLYL